MKTEQGREWPGIRGIVGSQTLLILVDFENKRDNERPDFYILDEKDWQDFLKKHVISNPKLDQIIEGYIPQWKDEYIAYALISTPIPLLAWNITSNRLRKSCAQRFSNF
ncbi:MAG: hypothetical protein QXK24_01950 [Ignisphaera sp.]